jgi:coenzyme F420-reducing hydrogenase alpha subunit
MKKIIKVDYLSRVEGEGGFLIEIKDGKLERISVKIFEAPRFFEAFLKKRSYSDVIDFTARICGICPVAYQMSAVHAIEKIFGIKVTEPIKDLRRLLYCAEWMVSHSLHIYLLQGPDFYNLDSAWSSKEYIPYAKRGLMFKKLGNRILSLIGGRSIHPVSVVVGGFSSVPKKRDLLALKDDLQSAYEKSLEGIRWACSLNFNENFFDTEFVSLTNDNEYPLNYGSVASNKGLNVLPDRFLDIMILYQRAYSTALHSGIKRDSKVTPYIVGPLSRLNLNYERLPSEIIDTLKGKGVELPLRNTHMSIIARSVELSYVIYEIIRLIDKYEYIDEHLVGFEPCEGKATWITEAPRGMLIHHYEIDSSGNIKFCKLIPPTSQNLSHIERDIENLINENLNKPVEYLRKESEKIIRSYDPCISCSVHIIRM